MQKHNILAERAKVEIFTTPSCAYCKMAKEYFKEKNIPYIEYDVQRDIAKRQEMVEKTHQFGVPIIIINGEIVIGFDRAKINKLLGL
jgi:glutaredoxin-like YruB-family protein